MKEHSYTSLNFSSQPMVSPSITIMNIMSEIMVIRALYVATRLRLAEYIGDKPLALAELAAAVKSDPTTLLSLLRALASIGIFAETDPQTHTFANTQLSWSLHFDTPGSMRAIVLLWGADYQWEAWQRLEETVRTGQAAFPAHHGGKTIWSYLEAHSDDEHIFSTAMTAMSSSINPLILEHYDFSTYRIVVDIGGGYASLLHELLAHYSHLSAILLDRPSVVEDVKVLYPRKLFRLDLSDTLKS